MRNFNPDKELNKIKYGKRNKVFLGIILLLVISLVGTTFALYQVRHTKRIIYTTVDDFKNIKDINLAVYVDGIKQDDFPKKNDNLIYTKINCDKQEINASWDYNDWSLILESNLPNKCNVYFETRYKDSSGAAYPELYQGLIPVRYNEGKIYIADLSSKWYDYDAHEWANAVLIDYSNTETRNKFYDENGNLRSGNEIQESDILQMYVWIPRYKYKLWETLNGNSEPHMIEIEFEENSVGRSLGTNKDQWYSHPAFLFGDTELNGFWVGKFEPSDPNDPNGRKENEIYEITILPDKTSMVLKSIKTIFDAEQKLSEEGNKYNLDNKEVETRVIKNSEWGAVAYLTSSKYGIYNNNSSCVFTDMDSSNCEVWINNSAQGTSASEYGGTYTGCVGDSVSADTKWGQGGTNPATCPETNQWKTTKGVHASTTGNVYGIYDMSGGTWEYTMGITKEQNGNNPNWVNSGFNENPPDSKYYDLYDFGDSNLTHGRGHLGDSTRETITNFGSKLGGWNKDLEDFPHVTSTESWPWFIRGGRYNERTDAGVFAVGRMSGLKHSVTSFRSALSTA